MKTIAKILTTYTLLLLISSVSNAQSGSAANYLYQVGVKDSISSKILGQQRDIWIHIPADAKPYDRFPVVYVLDGGEQMSALATVYNYYWGNYLPKMILVGISNRNNRTRDLTTSKVEMNGAETGGAEKFTTFIEKELIPYIDQKYETTPYRTLIGHSYAGLFTVNAFINHKDLFNNYIAIDPSMDWDNQKFLKTALTKLNEEPYSNKTLFVSLAGPLDRADESLGIEDVMNSQSEHSIFARSILTFCYAMEKNNSNELRFSWKYYPNDIHGSVPLPSIMDGLRYSFDWYQLKDASKYNDPGTSMTELKTLVENRAAILSDHFGYIVPPGDEEFLNMGGFMFMQMGQNDKALLFLNYAIEYYPKSEDAHRNLAEYYVQMGDTSKAIHSLEKAYELSGNSEYKEKIEELNSRVK